MDGVAAAASIITIIDISARLARLCFEYSAAVKDAKKDIDRLQKAVTGIEDVLKGLKRLLEEEDKARLSITRKLSDSLVECLRQLQELKTQLEPRTTRRVMQRLGLSSLKWPFKSAQVKKMVASLKEYEQTFGLALQIDQT
jgi:septation ring formation regulator EzrA